MNTEEAGPPRRQAPDSRKPSDSDLRYEMPFCLERLSDGAWLALNRNYKPLGCRERKRVEYEAHPARQRLDGLTLDVARLVSYNPVGNDIPSTVYLHDAVTRLRNSPEHLRSYLEALDLLVEIGLVLPKTRPDPEPEPDPEPDPFPGLMRNAARKRPRSRWPVRRTSRKERF